MLLTVLCKVKRQLDYHSKLQKLMKLTCSVKIMFVMKTGRSVADSTL